VIEHQFAAAREHALKKLVVGACVDQAKELMRKEGYRFQGMNLTGIQDWLEFTRICRVPHGPAQHQSDVAFNPESFLAFEIEDVVLWCVDGKVDDVQVICGRPNRKWQQEAGVSWPTNGP
jgi:hypothetical protein